MPVDVNEPHSDGSIRADGLNIGQIGVTTSSGDLGVAITAGVPVMRVSESRVQEIGARRGWAFENYPNLRVRVLPNGTTLTIRENT